MNPWIKYAALGWAVFWFSGYVISRWLVRPMPSDLRLPLLLRVLFGSPRPDGTLNARGVCSQLFGYLIGVLAMLGVLKVLNNTSFSIFLVAGCIILSIWLLWHIKQD